LKLYLAMSFEPFFSTPTVQLLIKTNQNMVVGVIRERGFDSRISIM
jgi:hypothetical protein